MLSYHQFPQEGINYSLVTWLNGEGRLLTIPWTRSCLFCIELVSAMHTRAGLHCLLRHGKQRVVILTDFVAPKPTGGVIHQLTSVVYLIYQVMWSLRKIHALPSPGKWLNLAFTWPYWISIYTASSMPKPNVMSIISRHVLLLFFTNTPQKYIVEHGVKMKYFQKLDCFTNKIPELFMPGVHCGIQTQDPQSLSLHT